MAQKLNQFQTMQSTHKAMFPGLTSPSYIFKRAGSSHLMLQVNQAMAGQISMPVRMISGSSLADPPTSPLNEDGGTGTRTRHSLNPCFICRFDQRSTGARSLSHYRPVSPHPPTKALSPISECWWHSKTATLLMSSIVASPQPCTLPLNENGGKNTHCHHQRRRNTSRSIKPSLREHLREPEWANESPDLTNKGDEHPDTCRIFSIAVDSIRDHDCCDDLIPCTRNGSTDKRRNVVMHWRQSFDLNQEHNNAYDGQQMPNVAQP